MTTAATSLLGLALPVTGELSGTWGDTVNNAITSLLDTAVAGTTTLSTDGDVTLTTTTLAANQARQAIILWTANGTTTRNITAPAQSKIYTVINASAGTQSIVLRGAGPTTGVTIIKGESAVCAWNGSDFIKISNTSGGGSFTDLTVSGSLTLSGGTANGVAYLNGSKVVTTGSALTFDGTTFTTPRVLFGGSTLPAAGNPSIALRTSDNVIYHQSGSANTIVMLDSAQNTMQSIGATAQIWNISNSEQMRLNSTGLGIGTSSPSNKLHVTVSAASTAVSAFYNTDTADGNGVYIKAGGSNSGKYALAIDNAASSSLLFLGSSGNLGIGTSSPSALAANYTTVDIRGSSGGALRFGNATNSAYLYSDSNETNLSTATNKPLLFGINTSEKMRLDTSGNLGLGVTPSAWGSNYRSMQVGYGGSVITGNGTYPSYISVASNFYLDSTPSARYLYSAAAAYYQQNGGEHSWGIAPSGTAGAVAAFTQAMTLDADGDLGVGTTSPAFRLDVLASGATTWARIGNGGSNNGAGLILGGSSTTKNWVIANQYNVSGGLEFTQTTANGGSTISSTPSMLLDSSGNLGLGVTPFSWQNNIGFDVKAAALSSYFYLDIPDAVVSLNAYATASNTWKYKYSSLAASAYRQDSGTHKWLTAASGTAGDAITFTQAMTLTAGGNLALGTTSPTEISNYVSQTLNGSSGSFTEYRQNGANTLRVGSDSGGGFIFTQSTTAIKFGTNDVERARIDSSGNFLLGLTSQTNTPANGVVFQNLGTTSSQMLIGHANSSGNGTYYQAFFYDTSVIGSITQNGVSQVLYNISSDQRLKENIANADSASALIDALQVRQFDWKADGSHQRYGFVAQELVTVAPEAVHQPADPEQMMAVDYSKLVPMLVKEIQSLRARVAALES